MRIDHRVKFFVLSIFIISIIVGGFVMFRRLSNDKLVYETNLYSYIPTDITGILQVNSKKELNVFFPFLSRFKSVNVIMQSLIGYPFLVAQRDSSSYIIAKTTDQQQRDIKRLLTNTIFPHYPPKIKLYNDSEMLLYVTEDNGFFVCMFYNGFFIGGYDLWLAEKAVDIAHSTEVSLSETPLWSNILDKVETRYPVSLILNNSNSFSVFNVSEQDNKLKMEGCNISVFINNWICDADSNTLPDIDYSIFPDSVVSYNVDVTNALVQDTLAYYFSPPSYSFLIKEGASPVYALKHRDDKFVVYSLLNDMEEWFSGQRFDTNHFFGGQRIYRTSKILGQQIFHKEGSVFMTFHRGYLLFSEDRNSLTDYLLQNGKFILKKEFNFATNDSQVLSVFYSKSLKRWGSEYFNPQNPLCNNEDKEAYIVSLLKDKDRILEIFY